MSDSKTNIEELKKMATEVLRCCEYRHISEGPLWGDLPPGSIGQQTQIGYERIAISVANGLMNSDEQLGACGSLARAMFLAIDICVALSDLEEKEDEKG